MSTALVQTSATPLALQHFGRERVELLKATICKGATDAELELFGDICHKTGLDPFTKQIYAIMRWDGKQKKEVMQPQVSIDGMRLIAARTKEYEGQDGPYWCGDDGQWIDVWLQKGHPAAAKVGVYRKGFRDAIYAVATWSSYAQTTKEGRLTSFWDSKGDIMIAKCAEGLALRRSFPAELSGIYSREEMGGATDTEADEAKGDSRGVITATVLDVRGATAEELSGKRPGKPAQPPAIVELSSDEAEHASLVLALKDAAKRANEAGATYTPAGFIRIATKGFGREVKKLDDLTSYELIALTEMVEGYTIWDEETGAFIDAAPHTEEDADEEEADEIAFAFARDNFAQDA